ncbi:MAG: virulence factor [Acidimicrobiia bacterium]|nr:virulence factor [Acidimicrobiia bacterium]
MRERRTTRRGGRRSTGASLDTIYWRGIPAQLTARVAGEREKLLLHARFQHAIDRAAGVAGLTATDDYVNEWRVEPEPLDTEQVDSGTDVASLLERRCSEIEHAYPRERLEALVAAGGLDPDDDSRTTTATTTTDKTTNGEEAPT